MSLIEKLDEELTLLSGNMDRLAAFLDSEKSLELEPNIQRLLAMQLGGMGLYQDALATRITYMKEAK